MAYTVPDILQWARISQVLAGIGEAKKKATTGSAVEPDLHLFIRLTRSDVQYAYEQDPDSEETYQQANFLYTLCFPYMLRAQFIDGGSGGSVTPVTPSVTSLPEPLDWIVSATSSGTAPLANGESTVNLNGQNGMPNLIGYNIDFIRGSMTQYTTNPGDGSTYYSWNRNTGEFSVLNGAAVTGERFRIFPSR